MSRRIPDYYRHLMEDQQSDPGSGAHPAPQSPAGQQQASSNRPTSGGRPAIPFRADRFALSLYKGWHDDTVYVLSGPVSDGIQHNITICVDPDVRSTSLADYANRQVASIERQLQGCRVLLKAPVELAGGLAGYRAIFVWYPTEDLRVYQEQVYVLNGKTGYKLAATFSKRTRKTLGPQVERMMLSFVPF